MINKQSIEVYCICYNEEKILPYFLEHYSKFVDKITIYDNHSTDNSINIITEFMINNSFNIEIINYETNNTLNDGVYLQIKNNCWKNSQHDYVIVCDIDEFLYFDNFESDIDIITTVGYEMVGDINFNYSKPLIEEISEGVQNDSYSKTILFNPKIVKEINYQPGCHFCAPVGNISKHINNDDNYKLLHYKNINLEYVIDKHQKYKERLSTYNKINGFGFHYNNTPYQIEEWYNTLMNDKIKVI
jgi:hypothetical protein